MPTRRCGTSWRRLASRGQGSTGVWPSQVLVHRPMMTAGRSRSRSMPRCRRHDNVGGWTRRLRTWTSCLQYLQPSRHSKSSLNHAVGKCVIHWPPFVVINCYLPCTPISLARSSKLTQLWCPHNYYAPARREGGKRCFCPSIRLSVRRLHSE